jgi:hypothetical protein
MPLDDAADFAAGVCASANKPANDASTSPIKEALRKFMSAFYFARVGASSLINVRVKTARRE